ncbi:fungal specific transcription factor [Colletotrichum abscissum]|uniref:Fungal specific transcription factor n=1 Tax=Colletotrichum abscissum TaxID=1671311 RepID=A0A9Q0B4M1_9PEZI|nr:fungal specific transcription factor [Colletotrichum abscissum]KAI3556950.1 fungal specific transcription factor [Colletotrichum abscissum]KAK1501159.1 fungal specific transcription factor [Colletotrichum abscissum]
MTVEDEDFDLSGNEEAQSPKATSGARRRSVAGSTHPTRSKRAKYAAAACTECKKRKLKCIRLENEEECQRCMSGGVSCTFGPAPSQDGATGVRERVRSRRKSRQNSQPSTDLRSELSMLREQVATLANTVGKLASDKSRQGMSASPGSQQQMSLHDNSSVQGEQEPKQPQFVGPTRSAFSLKVAETSLTRMGISAQDPVTAAVSESLAPTRYPTPEQSEPPQWAPGTDILLTMPLEEFVRLLEVFEEEVEIVYPFIDTREMISKAADIRAYVEANTDCMAPGTMTGGSVDIKDVILAKVAIAISMVVEAHGKNLSSSKLVEPVKHLIYQLTLDAEADLKVIQIMAMISIYYFFSDEELLAWRNIGIAARASLEMGLHQNLSLTDNFPDPKTRSLAVRVFWCVYVLDRRWSFGTSLSFALFDRDIDPNLPEPSEDFQYLRCLIGYGRLCSKAWDALPPFSAPSQSIPKDTVAFLDFTAQTWLNSIPPDLQLRHPQHGSIPTAQPRSIRRLRALLYLRGNHIRTLIHRHHVISSASIEADVEKARLVVDIAIDSISVLVHLSETSDIYERQQSAFNYFLLSSLAVIFLAVCHGTRIFAEPCRDSFLAAVELVKCFSRQGTASRRLWKSIRGLLPLAHRIGLRGDEIAGGRRADAGAQQSLNIISSSSHPMDTVIEEENPTSAVGLDSEFAPMPSVQPTGMSAEFGAGAPDAFALSNDLMFLFDAFGQTEDIWANGMQDCVGGNEQQQPLSGEEEISRHFWGLI